MSLQPPPDSVVCGVCLVPSCMQHSTASDGVRVCCDMALKREPLLPVCESDSDVLQACVAVDARCVVSSLGFSSPLPQCWAGAPARDRTDVQTVTASQHVTAVHVCVASLRYGTFDAVLRDTTWEQVKTRTHQGHRLRYFSHTQAASSSAHHTQQASSGATTTSNGYTKQYLPGTWHSYQQPQRAAC